MMASRLPHCVRPSLALLAVRPGPAPWLRKPLPSRAVQARFYNRVMNPSLTLTLTLVLALLAHVALKFWLNARQVRHVAQHRHAVPQAYAQTLSLADHQKAADYTLAKARLSQIDIALDAAVLLGWTLLGGLDALNQVLLEAMGPGMGQQIALVLGFTLVGGVIGCPCRSCKLLAWSSALASTRSRPPCGWAI